MHSSRTRQRAATLATLSVLLLLVGGSVAAVGDPAGVIQVGTDEVATPVAESPAVEDAASPEAAATSAEPTQDAPPDGAVGEPLETEAPSDGATATEDADAVIGEPLETEAAAEPEDADAVIGEPAEDEDAGSDKGADPANPESTSPAAVDPQIDTNRSNYRPGDPVTVDGTGWLPGESVTVSVRERSSDAILGTQTVVTDDTGEFRVEIELPDRVVLEAGVSAQGDSGRTSETIYAYRGTK